MRSGNLKNLALVVALPVLVLVGYFGYSLFPSASNQGYAPKQPIPFSHKLHAGQNKIACNYCHTGVEKSAHATVPALNVCMNCHTVVKGDSPHIQKLKKAYTEGKPIEWVRIHELPDFTRFNHSRHIAKNVSCETCHGKVQEMDVVYQAKPLTMGWCINCHRGEIAPKNVLATVYPGVKDPKGPVAPTSCSTCHY